MAIFVKKVDTNEVHKVNNIRINGGEIVSEWQCAMPKLGGAFEHTNPWLVRTTRTQWHSERGRACQVWELAEGYELVGGRAFAGGAKGKPSEGAPKSESEETKEATPIPSENPTPSEMPQEVPSEGASETPESSKGEGAGEDAGESEQEQPAPEEAHEEEQPKPKKRKREQKQEKEEQAQEKPADNADEVAKRIAEALRQFQAEKSEQEQPAQMDEDRIREIAREVADEEIEKHGKVQKVEVKMPDRPKVEIEGVVCEDFKDMLEDLQDGYFPYMYGAAGCGKSHTAEQLAKAMGLTYYSQTTIQFAHDVRGYGDAGGNYQDTPFYKAFANGGLYFQDEFDRSMPEAAVVLNTALANGYYDFPIVGRVEAHPDFHFVAAGNTRMKGADDEYVSGQVQDASSRDRLVEYEMHYDRRIELGIARNDEELVDFVEDVRNAIKDCAIQHIVSYRATKYMTDKKGQRTMEKILKRKTFAGLDADEIRMIYGALQNPSNEWAKAMRNLF